MSRWRLETPKFSSFLDLLRLLFVLLHPQLPSLVLLSFELGLFFAHKTLLDSHGEYVLEHGVQGVLVFLHDGLSGLLYGDVNWEVERLFRVYDAQLLNVLDAVRNYFVD